MSRRSLIIGPLSLFSRKVEIALREKGLDYDAVLVPFTQSEGYRPKHPTVLAANPKGQVPVLVDPAPGGEVTLYDSTVIIEYLEDRYPTPALFPPLGANGDPAGRAFCRLIELEADEVVFAPVRALLYRTEPPLSDAARQAARVAAGAEAELEIARHFDRLEAKLAGRDYFCGDSFTAADIAMFMTVLWTQRLRGPSVAAYPRLAAWYARLLDRESCAYAAREIAAADLRLSPDL